MKVYIFDYRKFKKQLLLLGAVFVCAAFFGALFYQQQVVTTTGKKYAIYKVKTDKKVAALTFDISWGTKVPGPVLDTLKKYNVKCTFFISGPWAVKHPEFPRRIVAEGHEIASHGEEHVNLSEYSKEEVKKNILTAHQKIKEVTGVEPNLIRTPNGDWNDMVLTTAEELNYKVVQWSADSLDWKKPGVAAITSNVLKKVEPGAIILMHASDTCLQTPEALPQVLEGLKKQGYQLVTVSELLKIGPGTID
ncbi:polysaccharide deacetylase family sporulation protein PdaB [Desulforamulus putei DSM 12395]|uniref:Polysaccharide deacetylase family sporulation protein PdaB n=1 Tax=Desulforamulus putei DSM 12395 TaxID=1121429 RepID=A0A1M4SIY5_9FIRM|nr:polysaccharide deacetylase family sporulation protein PdaB [Desulforamulus putei]SHE32171.1 polysaccharide deacetylase family sporulation protein PdaB [Desulforamulus putei DSM 12395]